MRKARPPESCSFFRPSPIRVTEFSAGPRLRGSKEDWRLERIRASNPENQLALRLQEAGGDAIVAVKSNIVERCGHAMPARHGCGLGPAYVRQGDHDYISEAHGLAH